MTTNQTIDGVSRAALEMLIADKAPHYAKTIARKELRAQLDAPEVLVVPLTGPKEWLDSLKPAKGEPVAWYKPHWSGKSAEWRLGAELTDAVFPEMWKPLYAEQPAPVAVDVLSTGFYTTESGGGKYAINIRFRSMADMQAADAQLRELLKSR